MIVFRKIAVICISLVAIQMVGIALFYGHHYLLHRFTVPSITQENQLFASSLAPVLEKKYVDLLSQWDIFGIETAKNHPLFIQMMEDIAYFARDALHKPSKFTIYTESGRAVYTNQIIMVPDDFSILNIVSKFPFRKNIFYLEAIERHAQLRLEFLGSRDVSANVANSIAPQVMELDFSNIERYTFLLLGRYNYFDNVLPLSSSRVTSYSVVPIELGRSSNNTMLATPLTLKLALYRDIERDSADIYWLLLILLVPVLLVILTLIWWLFFVYLRTNQAIDQLHEANVMLHEAKQQAEDQSSEKSQFLANVSHELRTPLNAIIGFSEIIRGGVLGPLGHPNYSDYANDIYLSGEHLLSLINDILDYSKADAHKLKVDVAPTNITKVLATCLRLMTPRASEASINLTGQIPEEMYVGYIDARRFKQILLNLLSNAIKFTPQGGKVILSIWLEPDKNKVCVRISDTGIGIAAKDISKAMATFGQVDSQLSRRYEGTGLGLPLTKKLVELMNGEFIIQSELGFGTAITLRFLHNPPPDMITPSEGAGSSTSESS